MLARKTELLISLFFILGITSGTSSALTINTIFRGSGDSFTVSNHDSPTLAGNAPSANVSGTGNFQSIFNTAANWWESVIQDTHTITIDYGWFSLPDSTLGQAWSFVGIPKFDQSSILFDNDGSSRWFFDPTPNDSFEWNILTNSSADLGGGNINTGRVYTNPTGDAIGKSDLLTVALHEIGHALGFSTANTGINFSNPVTVNSGSFNGTVIPTAGSHININSSVLFPSITTGTRRLLSDVDILGVATTGEFSNYNTTPNPVPLPGALLFLGSGLLALIGFCQRQDKSLG